MTCTINGCTNEATHRRNKSNAVCNYHYWAQLKRKHHGRKTSILSETKRGSLHSRSEQKAKTKKPKPTGELKLFRAIWEERQPTICKECGETLAEFSVGYFAHIISKGSLPQARLVKENIMLLCYTHHVQYDHGNRKSMKIWPESESIIQEMKLKFKRTNHGDF